MWQHPLDPGVRAECGGEVGQRRDRDLRRNEPFDQADEEDRSGTVPHEVHLGRTLGRLRKVLLQLGDRQRGTRQLVGGLVAVVAGEGVGGAVRVLLHLVPHPAEPLLRRLLDHPVDLFEEVERPAGLGQPGTEQIGELVVQGLGHPGLPHERDRVDLVREPPVELALRDVQAIGLAVQPAMGVEHDPARGLCIRLCIRPCLRLPLLVAGAHLGEDLVELGWGGGEPARGGEPAVVADVDHVRGELVDVRGGGEGEATAGEGGDLTAGALRDDRGHSWTSDPGVVPRLQPVVVGQRREALVAPLGPPGVLHEEADLVVADDAERVPTERLRGAGLGDHVHGLLLAVDRAGDRHRLGPAVVHRRCRRDRGQLADRRLQVVQPGGVDPVEGTEGALPGTRRELLVVVDVRRGGRVQARPVGVGQQTVVEPALQCATQRRPLVGVALVVVVAPSQGIGHVGAHVRRVASGSQRGVRHRGDGVAGAGVARLDHHVPVLRTALEGVPEGLEPGPVLQVAGVEHVGHGVRLERTMLQLDRAWRHRLGHCRTLRSRRARTQYSSAAAGVSQCPQGGARRDYTGPQRSGGVPGNLLTWGSERTIR